MNITDIKSPADIKRLSTDALRDIAAQMRRAILARTSAIGGHVGPNLGDVEAMIALHYVFDAPRDKIVIDVSHQDFPHKMLTGRAAGFTDKEEFDKIGEYTDPSESPEFDLFYAGHTSPSVSLATGLAKARELAGESHRIVAFIGDGSLSGGLAFEGLDAGACVKGNLVVIVNDNQMAIAEDHGGIYAGLRRLRESGGTAPDNLFKAFGWDYIYVDKGNDVEALIKAFREARDMDHPVVVHINTRKGYGYLPAERNVEEFHWSMPFDISTGRPLDDSDEPGYESAIRDFLLNAITRHPDLLVISSATPESFLFMQKEREAAGKHYMDVAIAEQTGVSVMAGAARGGARVVYPVVASFLQRAYDQLLEDWAMNDSPALLLVMGSGVAGITDKTHLGFWDIPMISSIPDIVYLAPTTLEEMEAMMEWAVSSRSHRVAVRVPTYSLQHSSGKPDSDYSRIDSFKIMHSGRDVAIIAAGDFYVRGQEVADILTDRGIEPTLVNPRFISGVDRDMLTDLAKTHRVIATIEDGSLDGGFGQKVDSALGGVNVKVLNFGLAKEFADRYDIRELERRNGLLPGQIADSIIRAL